MHTFQGSPKDHHLHKHAMRMKSPLRKRPRPNQPDPLFKNIEIHLDIPIPLYEIRLREIPQAFDSHPPVIPIHHSYNQPNPQSTSPLHSNKAAHNLFSSPQRKKQY